MGVHPAEPPLMFSTLIFDRENSAIWSALNALFKYIGTFQGRHHWFLDFYQAHAENIQVVRMERGSHGIEVKQS